MRGFVKSCNGRRKFGPAGLGLLAGPRAFPRRQILARRTAAERTVGQVALKDIDGAQIVAAGPAEYNAGDGAKCQQNGHGPPGRGQFSSAAELTFK